MKTRTEGLNLRLAHAATVESPKGHASALELREGSVYVSPCACVHEDGSVRGWPWEAVHEDRNEHNVEDGGPGAGRLPCLEWTLLSLLLAFVTVSCRATPEARTVDDSVYADPTYNRTADPEYNPNLRTELDLAPPGTVARDWKATVDAMNSETDSTILVPGDQDRFLFRLKAAQDGNPKAQYQVALMYRDGIGVARNLEEACFWAGVASANGFPDAEATRSALVRILDEEQVARVKARVNDFLTGPSQASE